MGKRGKNKSKASSPGNGGFGWPQGLVGFAVIGLLIYGLIELVQSPDQMKPYSEIKKTGIQTEDNKSNKPVESNNDQLAEKTRTISDKAVSESPPGTPKPPDLPRETLMHISKGMGLTEQGKYELAELEFEKAAELSPNSPEVFSIWGAALRMAKKFPGANKRFKRANELAPDDEEILFNWGMSELFSDKPKDAIKLFERTLELDPKHYMAYNYLGKCYGSLKDFPNEELNYRKALEIKEDFGQAHFNLGIVLSLQKKFEDAAPHFQRAIEIDKNFEKPFVVQFLTAMGLKKPKMRDDLVETAKKEEKAEDKPEEESKEETKTAKLDEKAEHAHSEDDKHAEGSEDKHKEEGSGEGSSGKMVAPITQVKGAVKINGQPAPSTGVVILETKSKLKAPGQQTQNITIAQRNLQFDPPNSVVMVGSTITFANNDKEVHNIFSKSQNNQFNLGAMASGTSRSIKLTQAGPVILRCNLHKDMMGTLFVVPNGYFAKVDEKGNFKFNKVKSQEYIMQFWHPSLAPEEVGKTTRNVALTGVPKTLGYDIKAVSNNRHEIHDLVDQTDYRLLVDNIEAEVYKAIDNWKEEKKYLSRKRMLKAITYYFEGGGLKDAIAKSFSEKRSMKLESALDGIRKKISGIDKSELVTEDALKSKAERVIAQLRNNVQELEARLQPDKTVNQ